MYFLNSINVNAGAPLKVEIKYGKLNTYKFVLIFPHYFYCSFFLLGFFSKCLNGSTRMSYPVSNRKPNSYLEFYIAESQAMCVVTVSYSMLSACKSVCYVLLLHWHCSVNVTLGEKEERMMLTGMHTVVDIFCVGCGSIVGWKYVRVPFILESAVVLDFLSLFLLHDMLYQLRLNNFRKLRRRRAKSTRKGNSSLRGIVLFLSPFSSMSNHVSSHLDNTQYFTSLSANNGLIINI